MVGSDTAPGSGGSTPSAAQTQAKAMVMSVTVALGGVLYVDRERVDEAGLTARLKKAAAEDPQRSLVVSADSRVTHGEVVHVIDLAKQQGINRFAINVEAAK
jgi:biopolymer transport protein ExbD